MKLSNNTILITGGGSGIGRALAEVLHASENHIIIAGRNQKTLDEVASANAGMKVRTVDMGDAQSISRLAETVVEDFPALNAVFHVAGIMKPEKILADEYATSDAEATIATNLLGPIRLTAGLLPALRKQDQATILTVSSGLAFVPMAATPTYCATKAAIHSYTQSLRYQLRDTSIEVLELIPPYVATTLMGEHQAEDPMAMPLDEYISEVMDLLAEQPSPPEINVKRVFPLRFAEEGGHEKYEEFFKHFNDQVAAAQSH